MGGVVVLWMLGQLAVVPAGAARGGDSARDRHADGIARRTCTDSMHLIELSTAHAIAHMVTQHPL